MSILSVIAGDESRDNQNIYFFNFPTFKVSVPMKSGDILIFNSNFEHCSSNPAHDSDFIYSMYVSNEAVETKMRKKIVRRNLN